MSDPLEKFSYTILQQDLEYLSRFMGRKTMISRFPGLAKRAGKEQTTELILASCASGVRFCKDFPSNCITLKECFSETGLAGFGAIVSEHRPNIREAAKDLLPRIKKISRIFGKVVNVKNVELMDYTYSFCDDSANNELLKGLYLPDFLINVPTRFLTEAKTSTKFMEAWFDLVIFYLEEVVKLPPIATFDSIGIPEEEAKAIIDNINDVELVAQMFNWAGTGKNLSFWSEMFLAREDNRFKRELCLLISKCEPSFKVPSIPEEGRNKKYSQRRYTTMLRRDPSPQSFAAEFLNVTG